MEAVLIAVVGVLAVFVVFLFVLLMRKRGEESSLLVMQNRYDSLRSELNQALTSNLTLVNQQLAQVTSQVNEQLASVTSQIQKSTGQINERMDNAARVVSEVSKGLGALSRATEQIFEIGKDISSLQEILQAPKLRGGLGEYFLGDLLGQILPSSNYELQYAFRNGARVDAVIKLSNGLVPVDAKFPLENFKRLVESTDEAERKAARKKFVNDVKKHIDTIASSYILPDEGTFNFALMYIPAENVYYETIVKDEAFGDEKLIAGYAFSKRVIPVSPNSFYAYLQTILLGLRGLEISRKAREILSHLERLKGDFSRFVEEFEVLGKHLNNARTRYDEAQKRLDRFSEKLSLAGGDMELPP